MSYKNNLVNCVTNIQCEPKTRRLAKSNYQRPKKTYTDRKSTRLNSSHSQQSRMPSSA